MQSFQDDQKGLFTFYREQAALQQEFKLYKKRLKQQKIEQINKINNNDNNLVDRYHSRFDSAIIQNEQNIQQNDIIHPKLQSKDKLISLIRKQNAYQYKKNRKMQIFMSEHQQKKEDETTILKKKLQRIHQEQKINNEALNNIENQPHEQKQAFLKSYKPNPFQRLSIIPTKFQPGIQNSNNLDKRLPTYNPRKLFARYPSSNLQIRKNDKIQYVSQSFNLKQTRPLPIFSLKQYSPKSKNKKSYFPKIEVKSIAEIMNKINKQTRYEQMVDHLNFNSKIIDNIRQDKGCKGLLSQRQRKKNDISLLLQSVKVELEDSSKSSRQNKIHALFINSKIQSLQNKEKDIKKDTDFLNILKRMKFA